MGYRQPYFIVLSNEAAWSLARRVSLKLAMGAFGKQGAACSDRLFRQGTHRPVSRSETTTLRVVRLVEFAIVPLRLVGEADGGGENRVDAGALHPLRQRLPPVCGSAPQLRPAGELADDFRCAAELPGLFLQAIEARTVLVGDHLAHPVAAAAEFQGCQPDRRPGLQAPLR